MTGTSRCQARSFRDGFMREMMMRFVSFLLLAVAIDGCTQVDREALAYPHMPQQPFYHRADGKQLSADDAIDALTDAETACHGSAPEIGSPVFDACMHKQGYDRTR